MDNIIENLSVKSKKSPSGDLVLEINSPAVSINISRREDYTEEQLKEQAVIHFKAAYFRELSDRITELEFIALQEQNCDRKMIEEISQDICKIIDPHINKGLLEKIRYTEES